MEKTYDVHAAELTVSLKNGKLIHISVTESEEEGLLDLLIVSDSNSRLFFDNLIDFAKNVELAPSLIDIQNVKKDILRLYKFFEVQ